jgi:hypothetical protein
MERLEKFTKWEASQFLRCTRCCRDDQIKDEMIRTLQQWWRSHTHTILNEEERPLVRHRCKCEDKFKQRCIGMAANKTCREPDESSPHLRTRLDVLSNYWFLWSFLIFTDIQTSRSHVYLRFLHRSKDSMHAVLRVSGRQPHIPPHLEDHPSLATHKYLSDIFTAILHIRKPSPTYIFNYACSII